MEYYTASQIAKKWNISEQMIRRYCKDGRITAVFENGTWLIEKGQKRPTQKKKRRTETLPVIIPESTTILASEPPPLLKALIAQREKGRYSGLYDYIQINMSYSNNRMASGRMTRNQIEVLYKEDRIFTNNEYIKVNDIIEARNSFLCVDLIIDEAMEPLNSDFILKLHSTLRANIVGFKRLPQECGSYRPPSKESTDNLPHISSAVKSLLSKYEQQTTIGLEDIMNLHVRFEKIHPFEDCNGRVGRLIVLKECLRHGITPFIIDDKHRRAYLDGIETWETQRACLLDLCSKTQERFKAFMTVNQHLEDQDRIKQISEDRKKKKLARQKQKKSRPKTTF